jgi:hypothetical protein
MLQGYQIPVQNVPQRFEIELSGAAYTLENRWNSIAGYWEIDWYDADGMPLVMAVPVLGGADLLEGYPELPTGVMAVFTDGAPDIDPTLDGLGGESLLYYGNDAA